MSVRLVSLVLAVALAAPALVLAQSSSDDLARAHFTSASAYYEQGRYEEAAREFMESYRLSPRAPLLENTARSYERALLFDEAIATLEQMMRDHPDFSSEAVVRERIGNLERLRARVQAGGQSESTPDAATSGGNGSTRSAPPSPAPSSGGGGISIPGIAILGAGGAIGLVSIITGAVSHSTYEGLTNECAGGVCPPSRQGDIDTGNALAITSTVTMFASIAAIGVGVVLLIVDSGGGGGESARLELVPGPGEAGLGARVRF